MVHRGVRGLPVPEPPPLGPLSEQDLARRWRERVADGRWGPGGGGGGGECSRMQGPTPGDPHPPNPPTSDHSSFVMLVGVGCVFCGRLYGNGLLDGTFLEAQQRILSLFFFLFLFSGYTLAVYGGERYLDWDVGGRHLSVLGDVGPLHRRACRHVLQRGHSRRKGWWRNYRSADGGRVLLTVPLLPMERWLSCWVRGPIMEVGWMDMPWSIPEVMTAPWWERERERKGGWRRDTGKSSSSDTHCGRHDVGLMMQPRRVVYLRE